MEHHTCSHGPIFRAQNLQRKISPEQTNFSKKMSPSKGSEKKMLKQVEHEGLFSKKQNKGPQDKVQKQRVDLTEKEKEDALNYVEVNDADETKNDDSINLGC
jgi:hypothetical protein